MTEQVLEVLGKLDEWIISRVKLNAIGFYRTLSINAQKYFMKLGNVNPFVWCLN